MNKKHCWDSKGREGGRREGGRVEREGREGGRMDRKKNRRIKRREEKEESEPSFFLPSHHSCTINHHSCVYMRVLTRVQLVSGPPMDVG